MERLTGRVLILSQAWFFWAAIQPYLWFLFFSAVFFSSWVGGLHGGQQALDFLFREGEFAGRTGPVLPRVVLLDINPP